MNLSLILKRLACSHRSYIHSNGNINCEFCGMFFKYKKVEFHYTGDNYSAVYKDWCNRGYNKKLISDWTRLNVSERTDK